MRIGEITEWIANNLEVILLVYISYYFLITLFKTYKQILVGGFNKIWFKTKQSEFFRLRNKSDKGINVLSYLGIILGVTFIFLSLMNYTVHSKIYDLAFGFIFILSGYSKLFLKKLSIKIEIGQDYLAIFNRKKKIIPFTEIEEIQISNPEIKIKVNGYDLILIPLVKFETNREMNNIKSLFSKLKILESNSSMTVKNMFSYA